MFLEEISSKRYFNLLILLSNMSGRVMNNFYKITFIGGILNIKIFDRVFFYNLFRKI